MCPLVSDTPKTGFVYLIIDEILAFQTYLDSLRDELSRLEAAEVSEERIRSTARDLSQAMSDFRRSAATLKVKGWFGVSIR